jgi:hypothetical protein
MSEQEKFDLLRMIREELQIHRDYQEVKFATKDELNKAKDNRDASCDTHRASFYKSIASINTTLTKIDKQFIYTMIGIGIVGAIAGIDNLIPMVLRYLGI